MEGRNHLPYAKICRQKEKYREGKNQKENNNKIQKIHDYRIVKERKKENVKSETT